MEFQQEHERNLKTTFKQPTSPNAISQPIKAENCPPQQKKRFTSAPPPPPAASRHVIKLEIVLCSEEPGLFESQAPPPPPTHQICLRFLFYLTQLSRGLCEEGWGVRGGGGVANMYPSYTDKYGCHHPRTQTRHKSRPSPFVPNSTDLKINFVLELISPGGDLLFCAICCDLLLEWGGGGEDAPWSPQLRGRPCDFHRSFRKSGA